MAKKRPSGGNFLVSLLLFLATAGLAVLLLLAAAVIGLAALLDSFIWATLIFGVLFAGAAAAIYFRSLRRSLTHIREKVETVYDVARAVKSAYDWVMEKIHWIRALLTLQRED